MRYFQAKESTASTKQVSNSGRAKRRKSKKPKKTLTFPEDDDLIWPEEPKVNVDELEPGKLL